MSGRGGAKLDEKKRKGLEWNCHFKTLNEIFISYSNFIMGTAFFFYFLKICFQFRHNYISLPSFDMPTFKS